MFAPLAIEVTFHPFRILRQELEHLKNPVLENRKKALVYSIPCAECPCTYVCQTVEPLDHRLREHCRALKNGDLAASALAEHVFSCNHRVNLSTAWSSHGDWHSHTQNCCMLESCYIQHQQVPLDRDRFTLFALYVVLLDWPCYLLGCFYYIIDMSVVLNIPFSSIYHKVSLFKRTYIIFFSVFSYFPLYLCVFFTSCTHLCNVTTSSSDYPTVFIHECLSMSIIQWWRQSLVAKTSELLSRFSGLASASVDWVRN